MSNNILFYENNKGISEVWNFLEKLRMESSTNKDSRIQYNQIVLFIQLLENNGCSLPCGITKHIQDGIWELRPGNNRIFYFYYDKHSIVLLHSFRKKTQKTPRREIDKALKERNDYLMRKEDSFL